MNRIRKTICFIVSVLMIVSLLSVPGPDQVNAAADTSVPVRGDLADYSGNKTLFAAPWGNASFDKTSRTISGNTTVSGTGGNRNAISELYYGEFSDGGEAYFCDFDVVLSADDIDLTTWSTPKNHFLGILIGAADEAAFKIWFRLNGSNDILLGYSNDGATRKMSTALNGKKIMGLSTAAGTFWQKTGLDGYMELSGSEYRMHVVTAFDVNAQTLSLWINDSLVFDGADVKGSNGNAEYGKVTPAFGVDTESTSSERVLNPVITINEMWCSGLPDGSYDASFHDYSDAGVFSAAWRNTAAYDAASKTVQTNTGLSNPNSISELYLFGTDQLQKDYSAEFDIALPSDRIDFTAWGSTSQRLDIILGTAGDYAYKLEFRLNGSNDILLTYSNDSATRSGLGEGLNGKRIMGTNTTSGWFNQFVGIKDLFKSEDGIYRANIRTHMDLEKQTISIWINGNRIMRDVSMKGAGNAATYGNVKPALGFVTESASSSNVMNAVIEVKHVWSSEMKTNNTYINPVESCFVGDGLSKKGDAIVLNSSGSRGTLQGDAVFFDDLVFEDPNNYTLSAKLKITDHFNGSPINSTNPGLVSLIFAQRGNGSDILEVAVRPSISGQYGIMQAKTRIRWSNNIAGSFTDKKEPGGNAMMISSRLGTCPSFSVKETDGTFEYPGEAVIKVVCFNGRVSAYIDDNVLFANEPITPDESDGIFRPTLGFASYNYKVEISDVRAYGAKEVIPEEPEKQTLLSDAPFDADNIVMSIGVLSDPHTSYSSFEEAGIRNAAQNFIDALYNTNAAAVNGLDGIMLLGDYTSTGTVNQAVSFINAYNTAISAAFGDKAPALSLAYGNHDTDWGNCLAAEEWDRLLINGADLISEEEGWSVAADSSAADVPALKGFVRSDSGSNASAPAGCQDTVVTKTIGGEEYTYHLISIETDTYNYYGTNAFRPIVLDWLDDTLKAITEESPDQYVYLGMHAPIREGGTFGSKLYEDLNSDWGSAKGNIKGISGNIDGILKKYPQVVVLSGHTHYKEYLNTTIMQNNYTEINVCASGGSGGLNGGRVNIEGNYDGTAKGMTVLIEIDKNGSQRITRLDMNKASASVNVNLTLKQVKNQSTASGETDYPLIWAISEASAVYTTDSETCHGEYTPAWIIPAPRAGSRDNLRYYSAARGEGNTVEFPADSEITYTETVRKNGSTSFELRFPAAVSADPDIFVMYYVVRAFDNESNELVLTHPGASNEDYRSLWIYGNWNPSRVGIADGDSHLNATRYSYGGITVNTTEDFTISITPIDEYGNTGKPLTLLSEKPEAVQTGISIGTAPSKTRYLVGEELDITAGTLMVLYSDDTSEEIGITSEMVSGFDPEKVGVQSVSVKYNGFATSFDVEVIVPEAAPGEIVFGTNDMIRSAGKGRYDTAISTASYLKMALAADKFDCVIIASGSGSGATGKFPDALAGSYLAARKHAPILMVGSDGTDIEKVAGFVRSNLTEGGTVYILGGMGAVPASVEDVFADYNVRRLSGKSRYETNLAILAEAGVTDGMNLIVSDGAGFADALSASALGMPILLIDKKAGALTDAQRAFLGGTSFANVYVVGGTGAVPSSIADEIKAVRPAANVERISGANRYATSIALARKFFPEAKCITIATGKNFPDGLTGGPLSFALSAPLVLTEDSASAYTVAAGYAREAGTEKYLVFGGAGSVPDNVINTIMGK